MKKTTYEIAPDLVTRTEAALMLGITLEQFKTEMWRTRDQEQGRKAPTGFLPEPIKGGKSGRETFYRVSDIRRFGIEHNFKIRYNVVTGERDYKARKDQETKSYKEVKSATLRRFLNILGREAVLRIMQEELGAVPLPKPRRSRTKKNSKPVTPIAMTGWSRKTA